MSFKHFLYNQCQTPSGGERIRRLISIPHRFVCIVLCLVSLIAFPISFIQSWHYQFFISFFALGTVAEISNWFGHMWLIKPGRTIPFWSIDIFPFPYLANLLLKNPSLNNAFILSFMFLLCASLFSSNFLGTTVLFFWSLCLLDQWRMAYYHYWLFGFTALFFSDSYLCSFQLILSGLYMWSGFWKLAHPTFYDSVGPMVFKPLFEWIDHLFHLHLTHKIFTQNPRVGKTVMFLAVLQEFLLGVVYFLLSFGVQLSSTLVYLALVFNLGMHAYIIVAIGFQNNIETFINWNFFCGALAMLVFSPHTFYAASQASSWTWFEYLTLFVFGFYPLSYWFGKCWQDCWAHAYFAPGWSGNSTFLFHKSALPNMPQTINGSSIELMTEDEIEDLLGKSLKHIHLSEIATHFSENSKTTSQLAQKLTGIDGSFLTFLHRYGPSDPCTEYYGPSAKSYWKKIAEMIGANGLLINVGQFNGFGYSNYSDLIYK